ncbi:MAG: DEAD/DEAH box helicase, partial [Mailhella sp.]|nr:DEAD/DEAH box helicase [Mailhella sp.]
HLIRRTLCLDDLRFLVFDEADRMLSIGFYPDMKEIQRYLPHRHVLSALFSATYPQHVLNLAGEFLEQPVMVSLSQGQVHVASTEHLFVECGRMDKDRTLVRLLETENPVSAIIFCNTKSAVHYVTAVLQGFGYNADELSADLSQNKREDVLRRLREGKVRLLVSTDVAARGIDIPELSHVFLYEPPEDRESYIHRSGRTGRAGAAGTVISLVDIMQKMELKRIAQFYHIDLIPMKNPTDADAAEAAWQREAALLGARLRACTGLQLERAKRYLPAVRSMAAGDDEEQLLLLALLLDADYQRSLGLEQTLPQPRALRDFNRRDAHGAAGASSAKKRSRRRGGKNRHEAPLVQDSSNDTPESNASGNSGNQPLQTDVPTGDGHAGDAGSKPRRRRGRSHALTFNAGESRADNDQGGEGAHADWRD